MNDFWRSFCRVFIFSEVMCQDRLIFIRRTFFQFLDLLYSEILIGLGFSDHHRR